MTRAATILLLLIAACGLLGEDKRDQPHELHPLAVGNWWEYQIRRPQWENPIQDTVREIVSQQVPVTVDGHTYTAWAWHPDIDRDNFPEYKWLSRNGKDGLYKMGGIAETDTFFINKMEYRYPAEVGETWRMPQLAFSRSRFEFYVSDTLDITLIDDDRQVDTPAGTFRCYVYNFLLSAGEDVAEKLDYYMFYSPGVGLIKQEERGDSDQRLISELILIDYKVH